VLLGIQVILGSVVLVVKVVLVVPLVTPAVLGIQVQLVILVMQEMVGVLV
jgi:hypothetical protein